MLNQDQTFGLFASRTLQQIIHGYRAYAHDAAGKHFRKTPSVLVSDLRVQESFIPNRGQ